MCYGQFGVDDPRCSNFSRMEDGKLDCYCCGYTMNRETWGNYEEMLKHPETCHMNLWVKFWTDEIDYETYSREVQNAVQTV